MMDPMTPGQSVTLDFGRLPESPDADWAWLAGVGPVAADLHGDSARINPKYAGTVAVQVAVHNWTVLTPDEVRAAWVSDEEPTSVLRTGAM